MRTSVRYCCDRCGYQFVTEKECLEHEKDCGPLPDETAKDMLGRCYTIKTQKYNADDELYVDNVTVVKILRERSSMPYTIFTVFSMTYDNIFRDITMKLVSLRHTQLSGYTECGEDKFNEMLNMLAPAVMKMDLSMEYLKTDNTDRIQRTVDAKCFGFDVTWDEEKKDFILNKEEEK